jgi:hypothetical protein
MYTYGMDAEIMIPMGHNKTRLELHYFYDPNVEHDVAMKNMDDLIKTSYEVIGEDVALVEAVQKNLDAGVYKAGVLSREKENGVWSWQQEYRRWMAKPLTAPTPTKDA